MSASDKKKLRKEQQSAALTEKQQTELKKQKKQKAYTLTFIIAMVLIVSIVLVSVLSGPVIGLVMRSTTSVVVNDHEISSALFNYFYMDGIQELYSEFSGYSSYQALYFQLSTGINPSQSLESQIYDKETGETWADYFADETVESIKWTYTMYDAAIAAGHKLSESEQKSLDSLETSLKQYAQLLGYGNANTYLRSIYGNSANLKTFMEYSTADAYARSFASAYIDSLEFEDEDFREYEKDKMKEFNSYSYATFYVNYNAYLTGGTTEKDENGKDVITYSEEEKQAARDKALADAKALAVAENNTVEKLNEAIAALKNKGTATTATENNSVLYSNLPTVEDMAEWLTDDERKAGDITYITNATHTHAEGEEHSEDEDESKYETVNGYYVVLFLGSSDNKVNIGTVRHLLVKWELDKDAKEPTQAQKDAAKAEAEKLLEEYNKGEKTEKAFTELLNKHSDDIDETTKKVNNEGLYSDITPNSGYVKSFYEWACADHEKGDVEIIESEYGYHIMYFVEAEELNYRDTMINNTLMQEDYDAWQESLLKNTTVTEKNMNFVNGDLVIAQ